MPGQAVPPQATQPGMVAPPVDGTGTMPATMDPGALPATAVPGAMPAVDPAAVPGASPATQIQPVPLPAEQAAVRE